MKKIFSFCLFGSKDMYVKGLFCNIQSIHTRFPDWWIYVWIGDNVHSDIIRQLENKGNVKIMYTNQVGLINMSYRFFSIDDPDVEVMCVRDADSRVYDRDQSCVEDFIQSDKLFHIIRDHPNHHHTIMGGMWGIKKGLLLRNLQDIFDEWRKTNTTDEFWNDMDFLRQLFYPACLPYAMIHDELQYFEPQEFRTPFRIPLSKSKKNFIGQIYVFDESGNEIEGLEYKKG